MQLSGLPEVVGYRAFLEGCPILSNRVHWKMGHNNSIDSIDLSNGEFLYSIGKVQLSIGLLHIISET